jgi:transcriptional regulator with XRE-family HTH domain
MSKQVHCNVYTLIDTPKPMADNIKRDFGNWIKELRDNARLSQDGAARRAGIDRQQWYRIENGLSGTKRDTVIRIAHALSASPDEALVRAGFAPEQPLQDLERPKPNNVQELLDRLSELGVESPIFHGGIENLPDDPDVLDKILQVISMTVEIELRKHPHNAPQTEARSVLHE